MQPTELFIRRRTPNFARLKQLQEGDPLQQQYAGFFEHRDGKAILYRSLQTHGIVGRTGSTRQVEHIFVTNKALRQLSCRQARGRKIQDPIWQIDRVELNTSPVPAVWQVIYVPYEPLRPDEFEVTHRAAKLHPAADGYEPDLVFGVVDKDDKTVVPRRFLQRKFALAKAA